MAPEATTLVEVAACLDADEDRAVHGAERLLERLRGLTDGAVAMLDGTHFDIDERIRFCDARLAPEGSAAAPYYIAHLRTVADFLERMKTLDVLEQLGPDAAAAEPAEWQIARYEAAP